MRGFRLTERRIALVCAVVLVTLSVTAAWRQQDWWQQPAATPASDDRVDDESNADNVDDSPTATSDKSSQQQVTSQPHEQQSYSFTAAVGSSYTDYARQAISAYTQAHHLTPSADQLLEAEVALANEAGAPLLEIGQQVSVAQGSVKHVLESTGVTAGDSAKPAGEAAAGKDRQAVFTATAAPGDSYAEFARQCITSYMLGKSTTLSTAQRVAVETYLTQSAGAPLLEVGQQLSLSRSNVQQAVERAQQLSAEEQAAWQPYADTVAW